MIRTHHDQNISMSKFITERRRSGNSRQELNQKAWKIVFTGMFFMDFLAWFLTCFRITCLGVAIPTMDWDFLCQSSTKKITHRLARRPIWWRNFLYCGSLYPDNSCLCQVDTNYPLAHCLWTYHQSYKEALVVHGARSLGHETPWPPAESFELRPWWVYVCYNLTVSAWGISRV